MIEYDAFYIGTKDHIIKTDMPLQDIPESYSRFGALGDYIGGGKWAYASAFEAKSQEFKFRRCQGTNDLDGLLKGRFGYGFIYYCDPFAANLLPLYLANPSQAAQWQTTWDKFATVNSVATPANNFGLPISGANIGMDNDGYRTVFTFVVPDEADLAISIKGEPCQGIDFALEWGTSVHQLPVRAIADGLWDCVLPNTSQGRLARLSASGVGEVTLYGLMIHPTNHGANVASVTREHPSFIDGAGQSGCVIKENEISRALYALLQPWERDQFGISLTEIELFNI